MNPYELVPDGLRLMVRTTPNASRDAISGVIADSAGRPLLAVRVAAPAVEGAANAAVVAFLARQLEVRRSDITIVSGETARITRLFIRGDGAAILVRLRKLIPEV